MRTSLTRYLPLLLAALGIAAYVALGASPELAPSIHRGTAAEHAKTLAMAPARNAAATEPAEVQQDDLQMRAKADEGARLFAARHFAEAAVLLLPAAEAGYPQA